MIPARRISFWLVLIMALVMAAWWVLHVPYRPDRVLAALPAEATVVSVQNNLAAQWDALVRNPLIKDCLIAGGIRETNLVAIATNTTIREWAATLASDRSTIAFVPSMGAQHKPALVFASWIGTRSRILRWQVDWIKSRDIVPVKLDGGRLAVYRIRSDLDKSDLHLSLALSEGLILGCLSSDPLGARTLLETAEEYPGRRSLAKTGKPAQALRLLQANPPLWGWFELNHSLVAYTLELAEHRLLLQMTGTYSLPKANSLAALPGLDPIRRLAADKSDVLAIMPLNWLHALIPAEPAAAWAQAVLEFTEPGNAAPDAAAFIALLDPKHNGRLRGPLGGTLRAFIKGVKTPTLMIGMQVGNREEADTRIRRLIDQLNRRYALALVSTVESELNGLATIQQPGKTFYGSFEPGECIAFTTVDGWLVLASNASVLKQILEAPDHQKPQTPISDTSGPAALAHIQFDSLSQTVRTVAGVLKLASLFAGSPEMTAARGTLDRAGTWADVLQKLEEANISVRTSGDIFKARMEIGKASRDL